MASEKLSREQRWARQQISSLDVDYDFWDQKRDSIRQMSRISQSCIFTVDVYKGRYDFASENFSDLFFVIPGIIYALMKIFGSVEPEGIECRGIHCLVVDQGVVDLFNYPVIDQVCAQVKQGSITA